MAAWEKWLALKPFEAGSKAPAHPFLPELYTPPLEDGIRESKVDAHQAEDRARLTGNTSSTHPANTLALANVSFFAGIAGKIQSTGVTCAEADRTTKRPAAAEMTTPHGEDCHSERPTGWRLRGYLLISPF